MVGISYRSANMLSCRPYRRRGARTLSNPCFDAIPFLIFFAMGFLKGLKWPENDENGLLNCLKEAINKKAMNTLPAEQ
jgi:hypothetical protein